MPTGRVHRRDYAFGGWGHRGTAIYCRSLSVPQGQLRPMRAVDRYCRYRRRPPLYAEAPGACSGEMALSSLAGRAAEPRCASGAGMLKCRAGGPVTEDAASTTSPSSSCPRLTGTEMALELGC